MIIILVVTLLSSRINSPQCVDLEIMLGNGLGNDGEGGYYITSDGVTLGISSFFFHEEKMSFQLPLNNAYDSDGEEGAVCSDDFFLAIQTDDNPNETTWNIIDDDSGKEVLAGGPYSLPLAMYTHLPAYLTENIHSIW
jgi:hypothetical protein